MNDLEAMKALIEGKKIRKTTWYCQQFIHFKNSELVNQDGASIDFISDNGAWEIYEEPKTLKQEYEELEKDREKYNRCSMWHAQELEKLIKKKSQDRR